MTSLGTRLWRLFPLLFLIFLDDMGNALFFPLLPPIIWDPTIGVLGLEVAQSTRQLDYGLILAIFPFMMFLTAPIFGDLSDQYGRKIVLLLSLLGTIFGFLLTAYGVSSKCLWLIVLGRGIDGFTAGNFPIAQAAIIDLSTPEEKAKNISLVIFAISLGFIIGPVMSAALSASWVSWFTLATPLYMAAILGVVNFISIAYFFHESHQPPAQPRRLRLTQSINLFLDAFREAEIRFLSLLNLFLLLGWGTYIQYVSVFLYNEYHLTRVGIAGFNVLMAVSFAMSSTLIINYLLRYYSHPAITLFSLLISCFGVALTVSTQQMWWAWLGLIPISIGISLTHTTVMTMYSDQVDERRQGWVMGVSASVLAVAIGFSALIDGVTSNITLRTPLWIALGFYAVASFLSYRHFQSMKVSKP